MIYPVVVAHNQMKPLTHAFWPLRILGGCDPNAVVSGFFIGCDKTRGHHPPLVNVDATDTDKRDELALCLLNEHFSGQRQVGFDKRLIAPLLNSLDKREHLSPVDNTVDKLPTGTPSGGPSTSNVLNLQRGYGNHE
jgi:hypothetical protein